MTNKFPISLLAILVLIPITFSFKYGGGISFDRIGGFDNRLWIASLPISMLFCLFASSKWANQIIGKKIFLSFVTFLLSCVLIKTIFIGQIDYSIIKVSAGLLMFTVFLFSFEQYFKRNIESSLDINTLENRYVLFPLVILVLIIIASWHYSSDVLGIRSFLDWRGIPMSKVPIFITPKLVIYDFEQYYAFVLGPMVACATRLKWYQYIFVAIIALYCTKLSANSTAMIVLWSLILFHLLYSVFDKKSRNFIYKASFIGIVFAPILYVIFMYVFYENLGITNSRLDARYSMISSYINNLNWYQIIFPFLTEGRSIAEDMHNEFLEVYNAISIFGVVFFYSIVLMPISKFLEIFRIQAIAIVLVIFIGGLTVENLLHPYTSIVIAYLIAFYSVLSKNRIDNKTTQ